MQHGEGKGEGEEDRKGGILFLVLSPGKPQTLLPSITYLPQSLGRESWFALTFGQKNSFVFPMTLSSLEFYVHREDENPRTQDMAYLFPSAGLEANTTQDVSISSKMGSMTFEDTNNFYYPSFPFSGKVCWFVFSPTQTSQPTNQLTSKTHQAELVIPTSFLMS